MKKSWWNAYFYWNARERRGIIPLFVLLFSVSALYLFMRLRSPEPHVPDAEFLAWAEKAQAADEADSGYTPKSKPNYAYPKRYDSGKSLKTKFRQPEAPFDPNNYPKENWVKLGLSDAQAESIKKFEAKGGRFYKKEDLKKLYVISEDFYAHIEPHLLFPEKAAKTQPLNTTTEKPGLKVDINKADSVSLVNLTGITPAMAKRILSVRSSFGGFHSLEQMKDLYGFRAENFDKLSNQAFVGPVSIKPVNINYCTFKELMAVPGMRYETVKPIINHRERNGSFKKTEDLLGFNLVEPGLYAKIVPYLTVK